VSIVAASTPQTDAELFQTYFPYIKYLVSRAHIRPEHVEDYAMILMEKIIDKKLVSQYDEHHVSSANFKTFLSNFCNAYLYHFAERDRIDKGRSTLSSDMVVLYNESHKSGAEAGTPLLDYLGMVVEPDTESVEIDELIANVFKHFEEDSKMTLFFEMVLLQVQEHGQVIVKELAELFDVTRSSIHNWLKKLYVGFESCR